MINSALGNAAFNHIANQAGQAMVTDIGRQMAKGIFGKACNPLGAGPFAFGQMAMNFLVQGYALSNALKAFVPVPEAKWEASLTGKHTGDIDLGDGYTLQLDERNSEISIHNAETGETTRIWGDPHVDVNGERAFDFWGTTTFTLENGTKITIDTEQWGGNPDAYVASQVTITKGDQAIVVDGISQNELGDLSISMSNNGRAIDARTRDGFVLNENGTGAGWRSDLTGRVANQDDLNATRPGELYGPNSTMPSFDEIRQALGTFLLFGFALELGEALSSTPRAPFTPRDILLL